MGILLKAAGFIVCPDQVGRSAPLLAFFLRLIERAALGAHFPEGL